jgi:hypothetical protein
MKTWIIIMALVFMFPGSALAHPPSEIKLEYNVEAQSLVVNMKHVSRDLSEHRIRRIVVFVNGNEFEAFPFVTQTSKEGQEATLAVQAKKGDVIAIKAYCSKGGIGEAEYTVP